MSSLYVQYGGLQTMAALSPAEPTGKANFYKESFYLPKNQHCREVMMHMVLISRGRMFGGTQVPPQELFVILMFLFRGALEVSSLQEAGCFLPLVHSQHVCSVPSLCPLLLDECCSWINSDHLQSSRAFQPSCCSLLVMVQPLHQHQECSGPGEVGFKMQ